MNDELDLESDVAGFLRDLETIPWFQNLGHPLQPESTARQLSGWEDWPGSEDTAVAELSERRQMLYDVILARFEGRRDELAPLWDRVHAIVLGDTSPAVPYDPENDSWHGPTMAVWQAAWTAGLIAWCMLVRHQIPEEVQVQWNWFVLGHWPTVYTKVWASDRLGPLLVY